MAGTTLGSYRIFQESAEEGGWRDMKRSGDTPFSPNNNAGSSEELMTGQSAGSVQLLMGHRHPFSPLEDSGNIVRRGVRTVSSGRNVASEL